MLRKLCVLSSLFLAFALSAFAQDSRHFTFHYAFTVKNLPAAKRIRIWIPAAQSDAYQEVRVVSAKEDLPATSNMTCSAVSASGCATRRIWPQLRCPPKKARKISNPTC